MVLIDPPAALCFQHSDWIFNLLHGFIGIRFVIVIGFLGIVVGYHDKVHLGSAAIQQIILLWAKIVGIQVRHISGIIRNLF